MATGPQGARLIFRNVAVVESQLVNLSIVVGGIYLAIVVSADLAQGIATCEAMFWHADNDVASGQAIVIASEGLAAVLALVTFIAMSSRTSTQTRDKVLWSGS